MPGIARVVASHLVCCPLQRLERECCRDRAAGNKAADGKGLAVQGVPLRATWRRDYGSNSAVERFLAIPARAATRDRARSYILLCCVLRSDDPCRHRRKGGL